MFKLRVKNITFFFVITCGYHSPKSMWNRSGDHFSSFFGVFLPDLCRDSFVQFSRYYTLYALIVAFWLTPFIYFSNLSLRRINEAQYGDWCWHLRSSAWNQIAYASNFRKFHHSQVVRLLAQFIQSTLLKEKCRYVRCTLISRPVANFDQRRRLRNFNTIFYRCYRVSTLLS